MQVLRDYQERGVKQIFDAWREGARSVLAVSPTGSGKTSLFTWITSQLAASGRRSLICVHRRELATQASNRLREFGVPFGFIMAGETARPTAPVQIGSVQTLVRRSAPPADLVICDEAHLSTAATWAKILEQYPHARILGVTATPWRLSGKPLAGAYDRCVVIASPRELREQGYLCSFVGFSYKAPDLSGVATVGGEYNERQSAAAMSESVIVDSVVEEYCKHARDLSAVVFAVTVEHSKQLTAKFKAAGIAAEHLDGSTPLEQRRAILKRVEQGRTMVLCNVGVAVEGLDIPRLKCCILARPTKSVARAIQMMGRVRRPWNGVTARIHDHAFVVLSHGLPDDDRDYTLNAKQEAPPPLTTCDVCLALFVGRVCPSCAHENERKEQGEREIKTIADAEQFTFDETTERPPVEVRWTDPGRGVEGVIIRRWEEKTTYGQSKRYLVNGAKRAYAFPGTKDLDAKLARVPDGSRVRIRYVEDKDLGARYRKKIFLVEVDR